MTTPSDLPEFCSKRVLILGCGNRLFGDDGFGPAAIEYLLVHYRIPDDMYVMDVGTGVRKLLFTLSLSPERPEQIIVIDAVDKGRTAGSIFELQLDDLPPEKADDFSLHQAPSSNLAKEVRNAGIDLRMLVCQIGKVPESVRPGLSPAVRNAIPRICERIAREFCTELIMQDS